MLKVEIKDSKVDTHSGVGKTGKPFTIRKQRGYIDTGKAYPEEFVISLDDTQPGYPAGTYTINMDASVYVDRRYGELKLGRLQLVAVASAKVA